MTSHENYGSGEPSPKVLDYEINEDGIASFQIGEDDDHHDLLMTLRYLGKSEEEINSELENILRAGINARGYLDNTTVELGAWEPLADHVSAVTTLHFEAGITYDEALHAFTKERGNVEAAKASMRSLLFDLIDSGIIAGNKFVTTAKNPMLTISDEDIAREMAAMARELDD